MISKETCCVLLLVLGLTSYAALIGYRLFAHPLRHIPGPKLAASSLWYEFYFDVILEGRFQFEIQRLHGIYGPIVRISPECVHVNDPGFVDVLYTSGSQKRDKDPIQSNQFGTGVSSFGTSFHDLHRVRRSGIGHLFTKSAISSLVPMISAKARQLCDRIEQDFAGKSLAVPLTNAITCFTSDVITEYAFRQTSSWLTLPNFSPNMHDVTSTALRNGHLWRHFPLIRVMMQNMPSWILILLNPRNLHVTNTRKDISRKIAELQKREKRGDDKPASHTIIFEDLMRGSLPAAEKLPDRISSECRSIIAAGVDTVAWTMSVGIFHLLQQPDMLAKLVDEVCTVNTDDTKSTFLSTLEQLPYLMIVFESLRLSPVSARLMRISPTTDLVYTPVFADTKFLHGETEIRIPAGTSIGMSPLFLNQDARLYSNPDMFEPGRWLAQDSVKLQKHIYSFGKGSRQCVGFNLGYAELRIGLYHLMRQFGNRMRLHDTTYESDVECYHDHFAPFTRSNKGVQVMVDGSVKAQESQLM